MIAIFFVCSQWLLQHCLSLSSLQSGSWFLQYACSSYASAIAAAKLYLMAILGQLMPCLLYSSYSLPLLQCNDSSQAFNYYIFVPRILDCISLIFYFAVLDALFCTLVRGNFTTVQQAHWILLCIRLMLQLKTSGMCQIILLQLRQLMWLLFFSQKMSRAPLTVLKQRLTLLLQLFPQKRRKIQRIFGMDWIACKLKDV